MKAVAFAVPWLCCSGPRPLSTIAVAASPSICAARSMSCAGTPVMRSARSGHIAATVRRTASHPSVRSAMNSASIRWSRTAVCRMPLASAMSVPGVSARCKSATLAVAVRRGSETISVPPRARCASKYCMMGGIVSAGLEPAIRIASAPGMSSSGNGSPRSTP